MNLLISSTAFQYMQSELDNLIEKKNKECNHHSDEFHNYYAALESKVVKFDYRVLAPRTIDEFSAIWNRVCTALTDAQKLFMFDAVDIFIPLGQLIQKCITNATIIFNQNPTSLMHNVSKYAYINSDSGPYRNNNILLKDVKTFVENGGDVEILIEGETPFVRVCLLIQVNTMIYQASPNFMVHKEIARLRKIADYLIEVGCNMYTGKLPVYMLPYGGYFSKSIPDNPDLERALYFAVKYDCLYHAHVMTARGGVPNSETLNLIKYSKEPKKFNELFGID